MSDDNEGGLSRRAFLKKGLMGGVLLAASSQAGIISCSPRQSGKKEFPVKIIGANSKAGHMLNKNDRLPPAERIRAGVVIVGGGIAGLSAARELQKNKFSDFLLLDIEERPGGNAVSGSNDVSPFPWGAHYVPIPGEDASLVRELFEELGIIEGYDPRGLPIYNDFYLCADPQERLFIKGEWQEGLVPQLGISEEDERQYREFFRTMEEFRSARGRDGKRAFSIPLDQSSRDSEFLKYDSMSMGKYLAENRWDSNHLRWYVNYCCRDDYGSVMGEVSAWAGIHYFASRNGRAANAEQNAVVTWPEGNGWIAKKIAEKLSPQILCNSCVLNIDIHGEKSVSVDYYDVKRGVPVRVEAKAVIYAAPRFTAFKTIRPFREKLPAYAQSFSYSPWMVANLTMRGIPEGRGAPLSWDNVSYESKSLGYVVANHQDISRFKEKSVLTYYFPLTFGDPVSERTKALNRSPEEWTRMIVQDLSSMHPGIEKKIEEMNIWIWGHAMIRPAPKFIWGVARNASLNPFGNIFFAHSDMSGISIFEEAHYRGVISARSLLKVI